MRFFGKPWSAPATEGATFEPPPVGEFCSYWNCRRQIGPDDQGVFLPWVYPAPGQADVALHRACLLAEILGPNAVDVILDIPDRSSVFTVEDVARVAHEANRAIQSITGDPAPSPAWEEAPDWQRASAVNGVELALNGATPEDLHEGWVSAKAADGWVYGEVKDEAAKRHPCMVAYADLPPEQQAKDGLFHAVVGALLKR